MGQQIYGELRQKAQFPGLTITLYSLRDYPEDRARCWARYVLHTDTFYGVYDVQTEKDVYDTPPSSRLPYDAEWKYVHFSKIVTVNPYDVKTGLTDKEIKANELSH